MIRNFKAQNIIEYILLVVAVLLVFLVFLNPKSGPMKNSVEKTINGTVNMIDSAANEIKF